MDKTAQEKVKKTPASFNWAWSVVCKGCHEEHPLNYLLYQSIARNESSPVIFPKNDFSTVSVRCPNDGESYKYKNRELVRPVEELKSVLPTAKHIERMAVIESRLANLEARMSALEVKTVELPAKDGIKQIRTEIREEFAGFLADAKNTKGKSEDASVPYG
jgi:hypothetical protein